MFKSRTKFLAVMACLSVFLLCGTLAFCLQTQNFGSNVKIQYSPPKASEFLTYSDNDDGTLTVTGYNKTLAQGETKLVIPGMHDGKQVTTIGDSAFYNATQFTSLVIQKGIESIYSRAFCGCTNLSGELNLPEGLKTITGQLAFGSTSFYSITIPSTVTNISYNGSCAFLGNRNLEYIYWNAEKANFISTTASEATTCGIFANAGGNTDGITLVFGDSVKFIPEIFNENVGLFASYESNVKKIYISKNITGVAATAFQFEGNGKEIVEEIKIDSSYVYNTADSTTSCGKLYYNLKTNAKIYVLKSIENKSNTYLNSDAFTRDDSSDADYVIFTKV